MFNLPRSRYGVSSLCAAALLSIAPPPAVASDLSSNLSNPTMGSESASGARWLCASFATDASSHTLSAVTLLLANPLAGAAQVSIYSSAALEPGALIATLNSPSSYSATPAPTMFKAAGVTLAPTTTYWVVLRPLSGQFDWSWTGNNSGSGPGFQPTWGVSTDSGEFWWTQDIYPTQMAVTVDECLCVADYSCDGFVDGIDYDQFNNDFEAGNGWADINGDGFVDGIDYDTFNNAFEAGC
jgi:hypothetical protein